LILPDDEVLEDDELYPDEEEVKRGRGTSREDDARRRDYTI